MKFVFRLGFFFLMLNSTVGFSQTTKVLVDRLIAEVNGEPISYSEVMEKVNNGPLISVSPYPALETAPPFEVALQDTINTKLIVQKSEELQVEVTDEKLEEELNSFLSKRNMTREKLLEALKEEGMTFEKYKKSFKDQMILRQFQGRVIYPSVKITDKDIELYYMKSTGDLADNLKLELKQIWIKIEGDASDAVKQGKEDLANNVYQKLQGGMSFDEAVKVYSDNEASRASGGKMAPLFLKDLAANFRAAIETLDEGQFTRPIKTANGFYVFFLEKKAISGGDDFERKKAELENKLMQEEVARLTTQWLEDQRHRSKIRVLPDAK